METINYLDSVQISPNSVVRDLGVTMDCYLKFHEHTNLTVAIRQTASLVLSADYFTAEN